MLRGTMLAALGAAAAGTTDAKRPVGHRSAPIDDRSPKKQPSSVHNNLLIFLWRNNKSSWANAMSRCWEESTHWVTKAAWCCTESSPVQQAASYATIGGSIASNFAIDLKMLFSVQQRW